MRPTLIAALLCICVISAPSLRAQTVANDELAKLRSVDSVAYSPNGRYIAYTITMRDHPGRPYGKLWVMEVSTAKSIPLGGSHSADGAVWSHDSNWIAFNGAEGTRSGLIIAHPDGSGTTFLAPRSGTNSPLPGTGQEVTWSPDGKQIAFVSSTPGKAAAAFNGDPVVITRYLYKPTAHEGLTRFNDNQRLHIFVVDVASKKVRQLTEGEFDEHSIDWSPDGRQILFGSNHEPNQDEFFNYDLFTFQLADNSIHRLTATESCEYDAVWSPDGKTIAYRATRRGLTDRETTMEDTHAWLMDADGGHRREIGIAIDNRQSAPTWTRDGKAIYVTVQERGSFHLVSFPVAGGQPTTLIKEPGAVMSVSSGPDESIAYTYSSPRDAPQLYLKSGEGAPRALTNLNQDLLAGKFIAEVEPFTFVSNDNRFEVEAFLTKPYGLTETSKHPLIVVIHGGPHGQNGPAFNFRNQVYAAHGYAVLNVNYRGSTGYGQKFADAVFGDQDGNEGQDVLYGVSAAVRRYLWIDRERMGIEGVSYGGQLSDWLITQTNEFKAAIPTAGIANLVSYNYITYYNQYEEMEFGQFLHQGNLMDLAWERSALKHVAGAHTPTLLVHGENDNDVPIEEAEQFFIALKDVGVDTTFLRYPREGHGLAEVQHQIDWTNRSIAWYEAHFPKAGEAGVTNVQP